MIDFDSIDDNEIRDKLEEMFGHFSRYVIIVDVVDPIVNPDDTHMYFTYARHQKDYESIGLLHEALSLFQPPEHIEEDD